MTGSRHAIRTFPDGPVPVPMNAHTRAAGWVECWAPVGVFAALPTVGLAAGPSYASLVMGLSALRLIVALPERPYIDRTLAAVVVSFIVLGWATILWSVAPHRTESAALALTGI